MYKLLLKIDHDAGKLVCDARNFPHVPNRVAPKLSLIPRLKCDNTLLVHYISIYGATTQLNF